MTCCLIHKFWTYVSCPGTLVLLLSLPLSSLRRDVTVSIQEVARGTTLTRSNTATYPYPDQSLASMQSPPVTSYRNMSERVLVHIYSFWKAHENCLLSLVVVTNETLLPLCTFTVSAFVHLPHSFLYAGALLRGSATIVSANAFGYNEAKHLNVVMFS